MAPGAILGYWSIRGLVEPIRYLLEYVGDNYEEKIYNIGPAPDFDKSDWLKEKFSLGLQFPNLPYYIDGDVKITQTLAIIKYIARKHGLAGNPTQMYTIEMLENHLADTRWKLVMLCYGPDYDKNYEEFTKDSLPTALKMIHTFLGSNKWLLEEITYMDFLLYELLAVSCALDASALKPFPKLKEFMTTFESLDKIKVYMASARFMKHPFHGPMAKLG